MKKIIFALVLFLLPSIILANEIKNIDMDIYVDNNGTAHVTEKWTVKAKNNTEFYKQYKNLNESSITNYKVNMNGKNFELVDWNINASFEEKAYKYGYNYIYDGVELCFGISNYGNNNYTLSYDITNFIYNTSDNYQLAYWNLIQPSSDMIDNVNIKIHSDFKYSDTLDVWGYGKYGAPCYVYDGVIEMTSEGAMGSSEYMTIIVKFPANSFNTTATMNNDFNYYLDMANEGATPYKHKKNNGILSAIAEALPIVLGIGIPLIVIILRTMLHKKKKYGYKNNKTIDKANTPLFREIPCNKDMYYANCLVSLNDKLYKEYQETNIFGAIILKWVKENKVTFKTETKGIFNKDSGTMDLTLNPTFDDPLEKELFDIMYSASKDGILEPKELENWCDNHYTKFFNLFKRINKREIEKLKANNHIYIRTNSNECKYKNVMDDTIYEDSIQLYGLKKYFDLIRFGFWFWLSLVAMILFLIIATFMVNNWLMGLAAIMLSIGYGVIYSVNQSTALMLAPIEEQGLASSTFYLGLDIGMATGPMIGGVTAQNLAPDYFYPVLLVIVPIILIIYFIYHKKLNGALNHR